MMTKEKFKELRNGEFPIYLHIEEQAGARHVLRVTSVDDSGMTIFYDAHILKIRKGYPKTGPVKFYQDSSSIMNSLDSVTQITAREAKEISIKELLFI